MNCRYFITGATGNVGKYTAEFLADRGENTAAAKRPGSRAPHVTRSNIEFRDFDFTDPKTWKPALDGVEKIFLMRPPKIARIKRDMYPFLMYLKNHGIKHVVFMSVQGADKNTVIPHAKVEKYCRELELPYTFIRPSFFMQNLTTTHLPEIRDQNMLFIPAGTGKTNFIDARDIGEAAAKILTREGHIGKAYTVTGENSYSYQEVSDILEEELSIPVKYKSPGPFRFISYHVKRGRKFGMALVMLALYTTVKLGKADISTSVLEKIIGRKPRNLKDFINDHRSVFLGES
jgi:uncharacterized protein YbjT (DUF2867 family)